MHIASADSGDAAVHIIPRPDTEVLKLRICDFSGVFDVCTPARGASKGQETPEFPCSHFALV